MNRTTLSVCAALLLLSSALPATPAAKVRTTVPGVYRGEVVVHALGSVGLMIALDEAGRGLLTQTFLVTTDQPLPAGLDLRSTDASVAYRKDAYYVVLPREHRLLVLSFPDQSSQASEPDPAWTGLEITRIGGLNAWGQGLGSPQHLPLTLDDVEAGRIPPALLALGRPE